MRTLEQIREVTEAVVVDVIERAGRENLRNGTDPNEYITDSDVRKFVAVALDAWQTLESETNARLPMNKMPFSTYDSTLRQTIRQASNQFRETVAQLIIREVGATNSPPIFGEFIPGQIVQAGDVRNVLTALGGGSGASSSPVGTGLTLGTIFLDWLSANGINSDLKVWQYGAQIRRNFEGHRQLNGLRFTSWQDERLLVRPQDAWIRAIYYSPSDHYGCRCVVSLAL